MRIRVSSSAGKSVVRLVAAVLLASAATGCSSDATRFGGLFSKSDNFTTNSIASSNVPIPRSDVQGGDTLAVVPAAAGGNRDQATSQPFPDPVNTATTPVSRAREASTPINVQRVALADPAAKARDTSLAQPFPAVRETAKTDQKIKADPITTSTTKGGWSTANAPAVLLRQGDSIATLSKRFGVPEKEILKANGLKSGADAEPGQRILIPTYGVAGSAAKAAASDAAASLDVDKQRNIPLQPDNRDVAILPGQTQSREKGTNRADMAAGKQPVAGEGGKGGAYTVKAGDSLNRIAKANGVSVEELRKANGLTTAAIRIGQTLKVPGANTSAPDQVVTASVPAKKVDAKPETKLVKTEEAKPAEYTPPVAKESVTEVASKDDGSESSPKATGISKYRWPVRGQVIAGYGANVEGNRNDGINISVPEGTPIKAAENGVVIYSGSSLKELGNAVLVRHDDGTVTVYGNASELKVQRGQKIQRGQTLAASGMSGTATQPQVHFEVRKNASAVNPATFLE